MNKLFPYSLNNNPLHIDWQAIKSVKKQIRYHKLDVHDNICPICHQKYSPSFIEHLIVNRNDNNHSSELENQVSIAKMLFHKYDPDDFYKLKSYLYEDEKFLWKNLYTKDEINTRNLQLSKGNALNKKHICPLCNKIYIGSYFEHLNQSQIPMEKDFLINQVNLSKQFFLQNGFNNYEKLIDYGISFSTKDYIFVVRHNFNKNEIDSIEKKYNSISCKYCSKLIHKNNIFNHVKENHPQKFKQIEDYICSLFNNYDFYPDLNADKFNIPNWITSRKIINIWHEHFPEKDCFIRSEYNRIVSLTLARRKIAITQDNIKDTYEKTKSFMKYSNNNYCLFCDEKVTNNTWIEHYRTYHKDFFESQSRLAVQVFDNFEISSQEDYYNFGLRCDIHTLCLLWKEIFGDETFKIRCNIYSGREAAIVRYGIVLFDFSNDDIFGDDMLSFEQLKEKHSKVILLFEAAKEAQEHFKLKPGTIIPRIDIPQSAGFRSSWEANLARIFMYNNKRFDNEILFEIPNPQDKDKPYIYIVDFIDYDNMLGYGENTYVEVKGYYDERAKEKEQLFKKTYPDKKLIFIGSPDETNDFFPEINYWNLQNKYQNIIPLWETKQNNAFSNPRDFVPEEFVQKALVTSSGSAQRRKEMTLNKCNCYNYTIPQKHDLEKMLESISVYKFKKKNNYRHDLEAFFKSIPLANVCRIFKYHKKNYDTNVLFLVHDKKDFLVQVDLIDCDNLFGFGNNACILIDDTYIDILKKNFPDKVFKVLTNYDSLEKQYYSKILLWETDKFNSNKFPQYFNQALSKEEQDEVYNLKFIN